MTETSQQAQARYVIYVFLLATLALYWTGLKGPFLLDDLPNLSPLQAWKDGKATAMELILGNRSGILGRPVSMATLWLSAATGGLHPFPFKLGNLLIHIACGVVGWQLLRRLLEQDPRFVARAPLVAAVLAGLWLLHPINVSTVLYSVQRMAQLSALFVLLAVWVYVLARRKLAEEEVKGALVKLFVLFPLFLLLGLLSKENAVVAPALCLVVELAYFSRQPRSGKALAVFYGVFLLLPMVLVVLLLLVEPGRLISYAGRDFTLAERLLSQPRALMEYLGLIVWPRGGMIGVFVDDFVKSTGLLSPMSTLWAILALLGISVFAIVVRRQAPSIFAGWFFFLVAHGVESSFLPLELYFDHRNYLPVFGILLAMAGLLAWLADKTGLSSMPWSGKVSWGLAVLVAMSLAAITWHQAQVWRSEETLAMQALQNRPNSLRAALSMTTMLVRGGQLDEAHAITASLIDRSNPRHRLLGNIYTLTIDCLRGLPGDPKYLRQAEQAGVTYIAIPETQAFGQLGNALGYKLCGPDVTYEVAADSIERLVQATPNQPETAQPKWLLRYAAADFYLRDGQWKHAQRQAELAWHPKISDTAIGGMLVSIYLHNEDKAAAQRTLDEVRQRLSRHEVAGWKEVARLQAEIDKVGE